MIYKGNFLSFCKRSIFARFLRHMCHGTPKWLEFAVFGAALRLLLRGFAISSYIKPPSLPS
jgi:hypothetical protein